MKRAQKEPSQWFCPSCVASAADREDYLRNEGQLKRQRPAQKKKKEAEQPKKKEGKHGPCPYCKDAKKKMEYGNYPMVMPIIPTCCATIPLPTLALKRCFNWVKRKLPELLLK